MCYISKKRDAFQNFFILHTSTFVFYVSEHQTICFRFVKSCYKKTFKRLSYENCLNKTCTLITKRLYLIPSFLSRFEFDPQFIVLSLFLFWLWLSNVWEWWIKFTFRPTHVVCNKKRKPISLITSKMDEVTLKYEKILNILINELNKSRLPQEFRVVFEM